MAAKPVKVSGDVLRDLGFDTPDGKVRPRILIAGEGHQKTGKTNFLLTCPEPIVVMDFDLGTEGVVEKYVNKGRNIKTKRYALDPDTDEKRLKAEAEERYEAWRSDFRTLCAKLKTGTLGIDDGTGAWEIARLARFERVDKAPPWLYPALNAEFRATLNHIKDTNLNLVIQHKMSEIWDSKVNSKGQRESWPTGRYERAGFKHMGYLIQANLAFRREGGNFSIEVVDTRHEGDVAGYTLEGKDCTYAKLAEALFPDVEEPWW